MKMTNKHTQVDESLCILMVPIMRNGDGALCLSLVQKNIKKLVFSSGEEEKYLEAAEEN